MVKVGISVSKLCLEGCEIIEQILPKHLWFWAEDFRQELLISLLSFPESKSKDKKFLRTVLKRDLIDLTRGKRYNYSTIGAQHLSIEEAYDSKSSDLVDEIESRSQIPFAFESIEIQQLLSFLPPHLRRTIYDLFFLNKSYHEIASQENITPNAITKRRQKALDILRNLMSSP